MGKITIGKKEFGVNDKTAGKFRKALDVFMNDVCPLMILGGSSYVLGHLMGQQVGYKRGVDVGLVCGASVAYSHVVDTLKALKS